MRLSVSIIVPTHDNVTTLSGCIESILQHTSEPFELIVIDNSSTDHTAEYLDAKPGVILLRPGRNLFFTKAINLGLRHATGEFVFLMNDDCLVLRSDWLDFYASLLVRDPRIGAVGPYWGAIEELPYGWIEPYASMYPKQVFDELGELPFYDESFLLWWSDIYHSYKLMKHGRQLVPLARPVVERFVHHRREGESGETVRRMRPHLPRSCFEFHGKALMYKRLGIRGDDELAGYYGDRVWDGDCLDLSESAM
jgi:glycosyltransferase involved in cell wall biosynthesis